MTGRLEIASRIKRRTGGLCGEAKEVKADAEGRRRVSLRGRGDIVAAGFGGGPVTVEEIVANSFCYHLLGPGVIQISMIGVIRFSMNEVRLRNQSVMMTKLEGYVTVQPHTLKANKRKVRHLPAH